MTAEIHGATQSSEPLDLRMLIEKIPALVLCALADGSVEFVNRAWQEYTGCSLQQLSGWVWQTTIHPGDVAKFIDEWTVALAGGKPFQTEARIRRADGQYHWFLIRKALAVTPTLGRESSLRALIACEDINERKEAEAKLQESEILLQAFFENSPNLIFVKDRRSRYLYANKEFKKAFHVTDEIKGKTDDELFSAEQAAAFQAVDRQVLEAGVPTKFEDVVLYEDGQHTRIVQTFPLFNAEGEIYAIGGVVTDITERKQAEAYLLEAQRLSQTGSWSWNPATGDIRYWSEECFRVLGFDPQAPPPRFETFFQRIHPEDQAHSRERLGKAISEKADFELDYRIVHPDKGVRDIHVVGHAVLDQSSDVREFVGTVIDITERKRADEERRAAEQERERLHQLEADLAHINRVSTLGEMAASLAHEIKQPIAAAITSANSCTEWLAHEPPNLDRARAAAARIDKYGNRAAEIIDHIRSLYKKSPPRRELVEVNGMIQEMLTLLKGEATRSSIAMRTDLSAELPKVMVDRVQLQQVFMNLMLNAIEAMRDSGGELAVKSELQDGQLQFSVSDTGVGLPTEKMDQIFSAFFTTKPQGSGMGLAISRSIVESHGGQLWASANDGRGATFHFTLPTHMTETPSQVNLVTLE
jgi:PAS domain S-box-containing protein